jgi:hypothetical protein
VLHQSHNIQPSTFYYHFKRDPNKGLEDGAYYVLGLGMNTEDRSQISVILKPLYYCDPQKTDEKGISYQIRPLEYFVTPIDRESYTGPRFKLITDQKIIDQLKDHPLFASKFLDE